MINKNYFQQREIDVTEKLRQVRSDLPIITNEFFIGIETTTSALTRLGYALDLRIFFDYLVNQIDGFIGLNIKSIGYDSLAKVDAMHIEMFLEYLTFYTFDGKEYKNTIKTKARKLSTLKSYFKFCYCRNRIPADPAAKVSSPKLHEKPIIRFEHEEMNNFLEDVESGSKLQGKQVAFHDHYLKDRDLAIMTLFLGTGIRISELVGIDLDDIDFSTNAFKVTRKGGNQTILYFNDEVKEALLKYLDTRSKNTKVEDEPALFVSLKNKRISVRNVQVLVKKYAEQTTPLKHITPHKLRTTFGTNLYTETKDIYVVAEVLGHKDVNTTRKHYAAVSDSIKRDAIKHVYLREDSQSNDDN